MYLGDLQEGQELTVVISEVGTGRKLELPTIIRKTSALNKRLVFTDICTYGNKTIKLNSSNKIRLSVKFRLNSPDKNQRYSVISNIIVQKYVRHSGELLMAISSESQSKTLEMRTAARIPYEGTVYCKRIINSPSATGRIKNISVNGILFESEDFEAEKGRVFPLTIKLNGTNKVYSLPATVRRIVPGSKDKRSIQYGCSFGEHSGLSRELYRIMSSKVRTAPEIKFGNA